MRGVFDERLGEHLFEIVDGAGLGYEGYVTVTRVSRDWKVECKS